MVKNVWEGYMEPFRVIGNVYFVGTVPASSHLIDTGDGLILLDSGYQETLYLVMDGIRKLGFSPYDIKLILHSHGHIDHAGATRALVELTGAKTAIGRYDCDYVTGKRDLTFAKELGMQYEGHFIPDRLLDDGDVIELGNTKIKCLHTPGHTEGTMSYFFETEDAGRKLLVGMHGGVGMNSMEKEFLQSYALPLSLRQDFIAGLERLRKIPVDVFIGNHQNQCDTMGKYQRICHGEDDAFVDRRSWTDFLDLCDQRVHDLLAKEEQ